MQDISDTTLNKTVPLNKLEHPMHGMECEICNTRCYNTLGHYFEEGDKPCSCGEFKNLAEAEKALGIQGEK